MSESLKPLIIATVLLLAICAGWYFVIYRPDASKLETVEQDAKDLLLRLQSFAVTDKQLAALEKQIEKLQEEIVNTQSKLIPKDQLSKIVAQIQKRGKARGLKFDIMIPDFDSLINDPDEGNVIEDLLKLKVHMKIQGRYKNFGKFTDSFAGLPFYISVDELLLVYNEQIHPEIEILMDAVLYLRRTVGAQLKT